ncbi:transposable element Tc1 transposase [Trichonephila clavipes]|nr:transposable element Tc1 transposase [Trichonephila clavipes]
MTNRLKRIAFEKDYIHKPLEFWRTVIFSDEGKFCIFGIKGCKLAWRKPCTALQKEHLVSTVKHGGGGVMVWGCMASNDAGKFEGGQSQMETAQWLEEAQSIVSKLLNQFQIIGSITRKPSQDHPKATISAQDCYFILMTRRYRQRTAIEHSSDLDAVFGK